MCHSNDALKAHEGAHSARGRKRKADEVTPIIEAMPRDIARKMRPVFDGPSRSLSVSQPARNKRTGK
jgi:hypothetical protein